MLIPAILKREEIQEAIQKYYYTEDMLLMSGGLYNWCPTFSDDYNSGRFQYAVVDNNNVLIGYIDFTIDWYAKMAHNFAMISFKRDNFLFGAALREILNKCINEYKVHRIEWRMVGGNPVEKHYDKFCKKYNGNKVILHDAIRDSTGNYRDDIIYEILFNDEKE